MWYVFSLVLLALIGFVAGASITGQVQGGFVVGMVMVTGGGLFVSLFRPRRR